MPSVHSKKKFPIKKRKDDETKSRLLIQRENVDRAIFSIASVEKPETLFRNNRNLGGIGVSCVVRVHGTSNVERTRIDAETARRIKLRS